MTRSPNTTRLSLTLVATLAAAAFVSWSVWHGPVLALGVMAGIAVLSVPLAIVFGQPRSHVISSWSLRNILQDAGDHSLGVEELERRLRNALGDATLTLSPWNPGESTFPDTQNAAVAAQATSHRVTRRLTFRGRRLGDISYDKHIDDVSDLAPSFATAMLLGHSNELLLEQLDETRHAAQTAVREREQLERDLHDGATQRVSSLLLGLARLRQTLTQSNQLSADLARLEQHALLLREDLRRLSHGIYPAALVERGVLAALSEATLASSERITFSGELPRLPGPIEHALYFSTLEAVQNALRHGGSWTRVTVQLAQTDVVVVSRVSDNGVGFNPLEQIDEAQHRGLVGIRERATTVGGTLAVHSEPGEGTAVTVVIPAMTEAA
jgi:signal transduction histidine kinase